MRSKFTVLLPLRGHLEDRHKDSELSAQRLQLCILRLVGEARSHVLDRRAGGVSISHSSRFLLALPHQAFDLPIIFLSTRLRVTEAKDVIGPCTTSPIPPRFISSRSLYPKIAHHRPAGDIALKMRSHKDIVGIITSTQQLTSKLTFKGV